MLAALTFWLGSMEHSVGTPTRLAAVRGAMEAKAQRNARFQLGPDTDTLIGAGLRRDGCHFSVEGLERDHCAPSTSKLNTPAIRLSP